MVTTIIRLAKLRTIISSHFVTDLGVKYIILSHYVITVFAKVVNFFYVHIIYVPVYFLNSVCIYSPKQKNHYVSYFKQTFVYKKLVHCIS